jgi:hypothetical protein
MEERTKRLNEDMEDLMNESKSVITENKENINKSSIKSSRK